jgi:hypothetical protein
VLASLETLLCAVLHESEHDQEENERAPALLRWLAAPLRARFLSEVSALDFSETLSAASLAMLAERMLLAL